jgi:hypothetical protein
VNYQRDGNGSQAVKRWYALDTREEVIEGHSVPHAVVEDRLTTREAM